MSEIKTAEQRIHKLEGGEGDSFVTFEQALIAERDDLRAALAECYVSLAKTRVQLAGCGVAAMQNTEALKADRVTPGDYGWSESYGDVCRAIDREIELRARLAALENQEPVALLAQGISKGVVGAAKLYFPQERQEAIEFCTAAHEKGGYPVTEIRPLFAAAGAAPDQSAEVLRLRAALESISAKCPEGLGLQLLIKNTLGEQS